MDNVCYGLRASGIRKPDAEQARRRQARRRRPRRLRAPAAQRAVRRPAAARRGGPRHRAGAEGAAVRRAAVQPRRQAAPPRARGHPRAAAVAGPDRGLRHARPGGGAGRLRPHHRHAGSARIVQDGTPRELYEQPADRFIADFIGNANLLPGDRHPPRRDDGARSALGGARVQLPHRDCRPAARLAVRPAGFRLRPGAAASRRDRRRGPQEPPISAATWNTRSRSTRSEARSSCSTPTSARPFAPGTAVGVAITPAPPPWCRRTESRHGSSSTRASASRSPSPCRPGTLALACAAASAPTESEEPDRLLHRGRPRGRAPDPGRARRPLRRRRDRRGIWRRAGETASGSSTRSTAPPNTSTAPSAGACRWPICLRRRDRDRHHLSRRSTTGCSSPGAARAHP